MSDKQINQRKALAILKKGESLGDYSIQLDETKVEALDAMLLRKNGIPLPDELVYYADEDIQFDDDAALTDEDLEHGKLVRVVHANVKIDNEIADWIHDSKIDLDVLFVRIDPGVLSKKKKHPKPAGTQAAHPLRLRVKQPVQKQRLGDVY
ncbi:MAG: hypothetical protein IPL27_01975 [Lewinellaceae bacterium]|nr:hypothetical protein [Lewinellaceae bacterium]